MTSTEGTHGRCGCLSVLPVLLGIIGGVVGFQFFGWLGVIFGLILGAILIIPIGWVVLFINRMHPDSKD